MKITTGIPRENGQIERINRIIIPVLTKLSIEKTENWYKHVRKLQEALNSTYQRSIKMSPFEIMFGMRMRRQNSIELHKIIEEEYNIPNFVEPRYELRKKSKEQIKKIQEENIRTFNKKRKDSRKYEVGDIVAIQKTRYAPYAKILAKYVGPYKIVRVLGNDRYGVQKIGDHVGPRTTQSAAEFMKPWKTNEIVN